MQGEKTYYLVALGIIVVVVIVFALVLVPTLGNDPKLQNEVATSSMGALWGGIGLETIDNQDSPETVSILPDADKPSLNRETVFSEDISDKTKEIITQNINSLTEAIRNDPSQLDKWIQLGVQWKIAGDYEGARIVWEYAGAIGPFSYVPFFNLGDLYHHYLKDYPRAERNLLRAIENSITRPQSYIALHELYKYSYTEKRSQAREPLLRGLENIPNHPDLLVALARYSLEQGNLDEGRLYYEKAIDAADAAGETERAKTLQAELEAI